MEAQLNRILTELQSMNQELVNVKTELRQEINSVKTELQQGISSVKTELQQEISSVKTELRQEISSVKTELQQEISSVKTELRQEISSVKTELRQEIGSVKTELQQEITDVKLGMKSGFDQLDKQLEQLAYAGQDDVKAMIGLMDKKLDDRIEAKLDKILATQITQGESINLLAARQFQSETELAVLKKAK